MSRQEAKERQSGRSAFALDRRAQAARAAIKAAWWSAAGMAARALAKPTSARPKGSRPTAEPAPEGFVRRAWLEAFEKDARDVAEGLYPPMDDGPAAAITAIRQAADVVTDAQAVEARRRRRGGTEARDDAPGGGAYPPYY